MDFLVLSHLRWNFVFQRPQQLMTRCSGANRVFFWEEPIYGSDVARVELQDAGPNLHVAVPHLPAGLPDDEICRIQEWMLAEFIVERGIQDPVLWYYTPMALGFSRSIESSLVVYDCMDELSAFRGAPAGLRALEAELFGRADVVFTGGETLYQAKRLLHPSVHCFPSRLIGPFLRRRGESRPILTIKAEFPARVSAIAASSTSAWTWTCSEASRRLAPTGSS